MSTYFQLITISILLALIEALFLLNGYVGMGIVAASAALATTVAAALEFHNVCVKQESKK